MAKNRTSSKKLLYKAFTMVELLLVISLIAILSTVFMVSYFDFGKEAKVATTSKKLSEFFEAISGDTSLVANGTYVKAGFKADNGRFPDSLDELINPGSLAVWNPFEKVGWRGPYIATSSADWNKDSWGSELVFDPITKTIRSCGANLTCNDADDVVLNYETGELTSPSSSSSSSSSSSTSSSSSSTSSSSSSTSSSSSSTSSSSSSTSSSSSSTSSSSSGASSSSSGASSSSSGASSSSSGGGGGGGGASSGSCASLSGGTGGILVGDCGCETVTGVERYELLEGQCYSIGTCDTGIHSGREYAPGYSSSPNLLESCSSSSSSSACTLVGTNTSYGNFYSNGLTITSSSSSSVAYTCFDNNTCTLPAPHQNCCQDPYSQDCVCAFDPGTSSFTCP